MSHDRGNAGSTRVRALAGAAIALAATAAIGAERAIDKEVVVAAPI